uniref:Secreted protein n=1 Tax=Sorangium cellulosum TaxID=56 RepID=Q9L8D0_SORCE|nr:unknown [Sorangium cellulosum]
MKHVDTGRRFGRRIGHTLGLLASMALAGCGGPSEKTVQGTRLAPGADARVTADVDPDAATTRLAVDVVHLSPPERLEAGSERFVVWQRPSPESPWRRVGVLDYNADSRRGKLAETTVPYANFELLITAEKQSSPQSPSSAAVIGPTSVG